MQRLPCYWDQPQPPHFAIKKGVKSNIKCQGLRGRESTLSISRCIRVIHFHGGSKPMGWGDPKKPRILFFLSFLLPSGLPISHFLEVPVPLTHSQGPSQSPFVNRTMFYNSLSLWDDRINNAGELHLSGVMRLFFWFGLTVMVIVCQTIYSGDNDHRLQLFLKQRGWGELHDWLHMKRQRRAIWPQHLTSF